MLAFACTAVSPHEASAQTAVRDSLVRICTHARSDSARIRALAVLATHDMQNDAAIALRSAWEAQRIAVSTGSKALLMTARITLGGVLAGLDRYDTSTVLLEQCVRTCSDMRDSLQLVDALYAFGRVLWQQDKFASALEHGTRALAISERLKYGAGIAKAQRCRGDALRKLGQVTEALSAYEAGLAAARGVDSEGWVETISSEIGNIYGIQGNWRKAREMWLQGLEKAEARGQLRSAWGNLLALGTASSNLGDKSRAIEYQTRALAIAEKLGNEGLVLRSLNNIGSTYAAVGRNEDAARCFRRALSIAEKRNIGSELSTCLLNVGILESEAGNYDDAARQLTRAFQSAQAGGGLEAQRMALYNLAVVFERKQEYQYALEFTRRAAALKDSIRTMESIRQMNEFSARYDAERRQKQIELLEKDRAIQELELARRAQEIVRGRLEKEQQEQQLMLMHKQTKIQSLELGKKNEENRRILAEALSSRREATLSKKEKDLTAVKARNSELQSRITLGGFAVFLVFMIILALRMRERRRASELRAETAELRMRTAEAENRQKEHELEKARELETAYERLRRTQSQLIEQEKLASLGQLTAGIAHEISNPLNFVNNFALLSQDLVNDLVETDDSSVRTVIMGDLCRNLQKINEHGRRADQIVQNMLLHARAQEPHMESVDVSDLLEEASDYARDRLQQIQPEAAFGTTIRCSGDLGRIRAARAEMLRALANIIENGCQAAATRFHLNGGEEEPPSVHVAAERMDDHVRISVRDNGRGISKAVREQIFNPFFTTKPAGQGTGLGLSTSYDIIVQGHAGDIAVHTDERSYTEFVITLPAEAA